ncbi:serine protease [Sphingomonas sp. 2R-10]|uniref:S1 family peptidase n=1 Tax=Sphingomonas sp. 2R-10 TaxID=3045148 RepID=UPI0024B995C7|nr:serine protease [Sphingomonas sp. 2R-10]MDJ0276014.1 serine protease [Sphingomonas sp. 2R-10]
MTAPGIDSCSLVPLYIEAFFGDTLLGGATAFPWFRFDGRLALVTNWHVVSGRNNETNQVTHKLGGIPDHLRVHVPFKDRAKPPMIVRVPTVDADQKPLWVEHPEYGRQIDIAALDIELPPPGEVAVLPMNAIATVPLKQRVGMPVFILGYPFGRQCLGMPVWKQATFASEPYFAASAHQRYLIVDTASRPGMSGSPVIQRAHGQFEVEEGSARVMNGDGACNFIGIYSGRFHTNDPSDAQLGRVWPAVFVREVVAAAEAQARSCGG